MNSVTDVSAGESHSLALRSNGTVWAWGNNKSGQLGNGSNTLSLEPVQASVINGATSANKATAISAGHFHSLALMADETVMAWGSNENGQLGDGTTTNSALPIRVLGGWLDGVKGISAGGNNSLARRTNNFASWGDNSSGQIGDGTTTSRAIPVQISLPGIIGITAGERHNIAWTNDNSVWGWGQDYSGQLGVVPVYNFVTVPTRMNVDRYRVTVSSQTAGPMGMRSRTITINAVPITNGTGNNVFTGSELVNAMFYNGNTSLGGTGWVLSTGGTASTNQIGYGSDVTRVEVSVYARQPITQADYEGANLIYRGTFYN